MKIPEFNFKDSFIGRKLVRAEKQLFGPHAKLKKIDEQIERLKASRKACLKSMQPEFDRYHENKDKFIVEIVQEKYPALFENAIKKKGKTYLSLNSFHQVTGENIRVITDLINNFPNCKECLIGDEDVWVVSSEIYDYFIDHWLYAWEGGLSSTLRREARIEANHS